MRDQNITLRAITDDEATRVNEWRYDTDLFPIGRPGLSTRFGGSSFVALDTEGVLIGYCSISDPAHGGSRDAVLIACGLDPGLLGKRLGSRLYEAAALKARELFPDLNIDGLIDVCNRPSLRAAKRAGFQVIGQCGSKVRVRFVGTPTD